MTDFGDMNCSLARALSQVGERWSLLVVREAIMGTTRFDQFQKRLGIARNILTARLGELVTAGVLKREVSGESARIFDYTLTEKGWDLYGAVAALMHWGDTWLDQGKGAPVTLIDATTKKPLPRVALKRDDGRNVSPRTVLIRAGSGADARTRMRFS
jgi:DNA-binding HxlR family transcriptional regulator